MLYEVIRKVKGKEILVFRDELSNAKSFMKQMRDSQRGLKVSYVLRQSNSTEKYKKKPNNHRGD